MVQWSDWLPFSVQIRVRVLASARGILYIFMHRYPKINPKKLAHLWYHILWYHIKISYVLYSSTEAPGIWYHIYDIIHDIIHDVTYDVTYDIILHDIIYDITPWHQNLISLLVLWYHWHYVISYFWLWYHVLYYDIIVHMIS